MAVVEYQHSRQLSVLAVVPYLAPLVLILSVRLLPQKESFAEA
jgi:hypothetical protein